MLKQKLQEDLKQSMLAKDALKTSVLRMVISGVGYYEIKTGGAGYEATDEDVIQVIQKEVKQRRDSIEQFKNANRSELVEKETKELDILMNYLPQQMNEEELRKFVKSAIQQANATSAKDMGRVMGILMPKLKGKADGGMVSKIVQEELS